MKTFEGKEFKEKVQKAAEEMKKVKKAAEEKKISEMENVRDHYISEITQELWYLFDAITPFIGGVFNYFSNDGNLAIYSDTADVCIIIDDAPQITVCYKDDGDTTFDFGEGNTMLSRQVKILKAVDAFIESNIDNIMRSAYRECRTTVDVDDADTEVQSLYHVSIAK